MTDTSASLCRKRVVPHLQSHIIATATAASYFLLVAVMCGWIRSHLDGDVLALYWRSSTRLTTEVRSAKGALGLVVEQSTANAGDAVKFPGDSSIPLAVRFYTLRRSAGLVDENTLGF